LKIHFSRDFVFIAASDFPCSIATHHIAGGVFYHPIIFNNACNSAYGFSSWFLSAGARSYIGTLSRIDNLKAVDMGESFISSTSQTEPIPTTLWKTQRNIYDNPLHRTYIHFGCHFNKITPPPVKQMNNFVLLALKGETGLWTRKKEKNLSEYTSKDAPQIVTNFLIECLKDFEKTMASNR
jgi:hypothetical protein